MQSVQVIENKYGANVTPSIFKFLSFHYRKLLLILFYSRLHFYVVSLCMYLYLNDLCCVCVIRVLPNYSLDLRRKWSHKTIMLLQNFIIRLLTDIYNSSFNFI